MHFLRSVPPAIAQSMYLVLSFLLLLSLSLCISAPLWLCLYLPLCVGSSSHLSFYPSLFHNISSSLCLSPSVCLYIFICQSGCLYLSVWLYLSVCLSVCLPVFSLSVNLHVFICLSDSLPVVIYQSACFYMAICLSLSVCLLFCLPVCLSVWVRSRLIRRRPPIDSSDRNLGYAVDFFRRRLGVLWLNIAPRFLLRPSLHPSLSPPLPPRRIARIPSSLSFSFLLFCIFIRPSSFLSTHLFLNLTPPSVHPLVISFSLSSPPPFVLYFLPVLPCTFHFFFGKERRRGRTFIFLSRFPVFIVTWPHSL